MVNSTYLDYNDSKAFVVCDLIGSSHSRRPPAPAASQSINRKGDDGGWDLQKSASRRFLKGLGEESST